MDPSHLIKRWWILLLLLLSLGVSGCNLKNFPLSRQEPASILVSISEPVSGEKYPETGALSIRAEAVSDDPITRMELWADGELVETYTPSSNMLRYLPHSWIWTSGSLGAHSLTVRAYTAAEKPGQSNVVNIISIEDPGFVVLFEVEAGDSLETIAQTYEVTVDQILEANPDLNGNEELQPGQLIRVPVGIPELTQKPDPLNSLVRRDFSFSNGWQLINFSPNLGVKRLDPVNQAVPALSVSVQGCDVTLNLSDPSANVTGYLIYRLNQGGQSFVKIASLPNNSSGTLTYQDAGLAAGQYQYYISAYTSGLFAALSETPSNIVAANITPESCPGKETTIEELLPAAKNIKQIYLYMTVNDKDWMRFPQGQFNFMGPDQQINFGEMLGMLALTSQSDLTLQGEGWGWDNGKLVHLGNFKKTIPAAINLASQAPSNMAQFLQTELRARGIGLNTSGDYNWITDLTIKEFGLHMFRWGTNTTADSGMWQVSSQPFAPGQSVTPACLLLTKVVPSGPLQDPVSFNIDFSSLAPATLKVSNEPKSQIFVAGQILFPGIPPVSPPYSPTILMGDQPVQQFVTSPISFDPCKPKTNAAGVTTFYVRIVPLKNSQPLPSASNQVVVKVDPDKGIQVVIQMAPSIQFYDVKILEFTEINVPDINYEYCIKIVKNPWFGKSLSIWGLTPVGDTICPNSYKGGNDSFLEETGNFIGDAINFVSKLYDKLSEYVTELIEKLNPFCIQAKFIADAVGEGENEVDQVCHMAAVIVVAAAKTYVGLPPSLPNFDQLTGLGKDYLVELAVDEMEGKGIPCPQDCKDLLRKGVDYSLDQIKNSFGSNSCYGEDEAHSKGIEPLCPPDGVVTVPDPRGQPAPPLAVVRVTRTANSAAVNIPQPDKCYVDLSGQASNDSYVGKTKNFIFGQANFNWKGVPLNAGLLSGGSPIPSLAPGKYVDIPIILKANPFWVPGHELWFKQWQSVPTYDDWAYLYKGATLSLSAGGSCSFPGFVSNNYPHVQGEVKTYGPLGDAYLQTCFPYCP
jgi:LysM repeat protein